MKMATTFMVIALLIFACAVIYTTIQQEKDAESIKSLSKQVRELEKNTERCMTAVGEQNTRSIESEKGVRDYFEDRGEGLNIRIQELEAEIKLEQSRRSDHLGTVTQRVYKLEQDSKAFQAALKLASSQAYGIFGVPLNGKINVDVNHYEPKKQLGRAPKKRRAK